MTSVIEIFIPGEPKGEPRHQARAFYNAKAKRWSATTYPSHDADDWKALVTMYAKRHRPASPLVGPVRVDLVIIYPRPKYMREGRYTAQRIPYTPKPDRDNLDKLILDQLTKLEFWGDDAQVYDGRIQKYYQAAADDPPGARVTIESEPLPFFEQD